MSSVNSRFTIRFATEEDAGTLTKIHQECFITYWNKEAFSNFFSVQNTFAFLAEAPDPDGMIVFRVYPDEAEVITLAVRPARRRQGIGRALLTKAMNGAKNFGARAMFLDVEDGNNAALTLYESYGFTQINRRRQYYRHKDGSYTDALVLREKL
ncbi:MAG: ribosomal protein S18-alanine N-acetyltransferase [Pseudomonadota bacterium]|nr:ribosomal protein S18-alanine N-acetyltransferase [Pseudomonadota bacterium]MDE3038154.1 ribosomal protein S18-alanine N-acetyltransferase [Pseudomonadota bacterium]